MYMTPLADIATRFGLCHHFNANDSQLYVSFDPRLSTQNTIHILQNCISVIKDWMKYNMLKLVYSSEHRSQNRFGDRAFVNYAPPPPAYGTFYHNLYAVLVPLLPSKQLLKRTFFRNAFY